MPSRFCRLVEYSGLEGVELVIDVEQSLGVEIPDEDAARILTERDLIEYLSKVLRVKGGECNLSQLAFSRLQHAVAASVGVAHQDVVPEASWEDLLPPGRISHYWIAIERRIGARLHSLSTRRGTGWLELGLIAAWLVAIPWIMLEVSHRAGVGPALVSVVVLITAFSIVAARLQRLSVSLPAEYTTVGDTARYFAAHHATSLKTRHEWTISDIEFVVKDLTREHFPDADDERV